MTAGTRRNGISKLGPLSRPLPGLAARPGRGVQAGPGEQDTLPHDLTGLRDHAGPGDHTEHHDYAGRHVSPRGKAVRLRAGKAVPVAAAAATLAAGTAAYLLVGGAGPAQPAQLNAAVAQGSVSRTAGTAAGQANSGAAAMIKSATATGPGVGHSTAKATPKASPSRTAKPSASASASVAAAPATHEAAAPVTPATQAAAPSASASAPATSASASAPATSASASAPATSASATTLSCDLSGGLLPENVSAIVSFLLANGYTDNAAAGIAGNIYQESKGNPESEGMGGGGLIGWTPLPSGFVTGDVSADLDTQLNALLTYNQGWHQYIAELDAAATPADAAYIYVTMFERAGIPAASTREAAATDVASACGI